MIHTTHRHSPRSFKKMYLSFIQPLCYTFLSPLFVSESEETSLSVSAFSLSCACTHTHTPTHQYSTCTDTQPPAPTETKTHTHTQSHTHTHRLPSAAVMAPSCQNTLAFSPSLTKAAWLSLSMQVHRDCCLSTLILSFLTFSSAVCILILLSRAFQPLPTYILNNALLYVPVYCIRLSFKCLGGTLSVHKGLYWLVKVFAHNTFPHYVKQSQNWIHCFVFLSPPLFLLTWTPTFILQFVSMRVKIFYTLLLTIQFETQWVLDFIWKGFYMWVVLFLAVRLGVGTRTKTRGFGYSVTFFKAVMCPP